MAELDHLSVHSARLLPDVFPLPSSDVAFPAHRSRAASGPRHRIRGAARHGAARRDRPGRRGGAMTAVSQIAKPAAPRSYGDAITAALIIIIPIALALICFAARLHIIELSHTVRAELLFALLLALMACGMPISIALGLSVLTYLFILSDVDPKMVGLKLFTSIDRFEIMAIPFFILAGNFLTAGGVARRMIDFASAMIGHWYGGLGLAGGVAFGRCCAVFGFFVCHCRRHRLDHAAGAAARRLSAAFRCRRDRDVRCARYFIPAFDQPCHLRRGDERHAAARTRWRGRRIGFGRSAVHGGGGPGFDPCGDARRDHLVSRLA